MLFVTYFGVGGENGSLQVIVSSLLLILVIHSDTRMRALFVPSWHSPYESKRYKFSTHTKACLNERSYVAQALFH